MLHASAPLHTSAAGCPAGPLRWRSRLIADALGVSEAALVAARCGESAVRLDTSEWTDLLLHLEPLGRCLALTPGTDGFVETVAHYRGLSFGSRYVMLSDETSTLVLQPQRWAAAFAVTESMPWGWQRSLQFFGRTGQAMHKVHLLPESSRDAFSDIVERFWHENQSPLLAAGASAGAVGIDAPPQADAPGRAPAAGASDTRGDHALTPALRSAAVAGRALRLSALNDGAEQCYVGRICDVHGAGAWLELRGELVTFAVRLGAPGLTADELRA